MNTVTVYDSSAGTLFNPKLPSLRWPDLHSWQRTTRWLAGVPSLDLTGRRRHSTAERYHHGRDYGLAPRARLRHSRGRTGFTVEPSKRPHPPGGWTAQREMDRVLYAGQRVT